MARRAQALAGVWIEPALFGQPPPGNLVVYLLGRRGDALSLALSAAWVLIAKRPGELLPGFGVVERIGAVLLLVLLLLRTTDAGRDGVELLRLGRQAVPRARGCVPLHYPVSCLDLQEVACSLLAEQNIDGPLQAAATVVDRAVATFGHVLSQPEQFADGEECEPGHYVHANLA